MSSTRINPSLFKFLSKLKKNNNRTWFTENKEEFQAHYKEFKDWANALNDALSAYDNIEVFKVHRIYRDVRFSKDKTPYKSHFSGSLKRATKWLRGGYYFHIEPGNSMICGGFWGPNSADLKRIREEIAADAQPLRAIITDKKFIDTFGELRGDGVKTAPKGFSKDHHAIDLLRKKQFLVQRNFTDKEVVSDTFIEEAVETFRNMRPFFDYMSEVLTTDANGVPIE